MAETQVEKEERLEAERAKKAAKEYAKKTQQAKLKAVELGCTQFAGPLNTTCAWNFPTCKAANDFALYLKEVGLQLVALLEPAVAGQSSWAVIFK